MASKKKSGNPIIDLTAGGIAGCCEALTCHPLDTIKVRMQLQSKAAQAAQQAASAQVQNLSKNAPAGDAAALAQAAKNAAAPAKKVPRRGFVATGVHIFKSSGVKGLYRGLGAVVAGITPKMSVRFTAFEELKRMFTPAGKTLPTTTGVFFAGLGAGVIEAVLVVNPSDVVKIRLQAQSHSLIDATEGPKYKNAAHCLYTMIKEEGIGSIYRGVWLTAARQATNQATNFTVYTLLKTKLTEIQPEYNGLLPGWQTSIIGLISGALGPMSNAPLDTVKTRIQREKKRPGESGFKQFTRTFTEIVRHDGFMALYRGITPRVMRVAPGQAVTFTVYEWARSALEKIPALQTKKPLA